MLHYRHQAALPAHLEPGYRLRSVSDGVTSEANCSELVTMAEDSASFQTVPERLQSGFSE